MQSLKRYLVDCENKRRRARDRPSNIVLEELRALLVAFETLTPPKHDATHVHPEHRPSLGEDAKFEHGAGGDNGRHLRAVESSPLG